MSMLSQACFPLHLSQFAVGSMTINRLVELQNILHLQNMMKLSDLKMGNPMVLLVFCHYKMDSFYDKFLGQYVFRIGLSEQVEPSIYVWWCGLVGSMVVWFGSSI